MACPECEASRAQYLAMRRAVLSFAKTLDQLETERIRLANKDRPKDTPPIGSLSEAILKRAGLLCEDAG